MIPLIHYPWTTLRLTLGIAMLTACGSVFRAGYLRNPY